MREVAEGVQVVAEPGGAATLDRYKGRMCVINQSGPP